MKKVFCFFLSCTMLVSLCACNTSHIKSKYSLKDYTFYSTGIYSNGPLFPVYGLTSGKDLVSTDVKERTNWLKRKFEKKKVKIDSVTTELDYISTIYKKYMGKTFKLDTYKSADEKVSAVFSRSDKKLLSYSREITAEELGDTVTLTQDQWEEKATDALSEYVDLSQYKLEDFSEKERIEYVAFELSYRKYISDLPTADEISISFAPDGQLRFVYMTNLGCFDRIENINFSKEEFEEEVSERTAEAYKLFTITDTFYKIRELQWSSSGKLLLYMEIWVTATHKNGDPICVNENGEQLFDEFGEPLAASDCSYIFLVLE